MEYTLSKCRDNRGFPAYNIVKDNVAYCCISFEKCTPVHFLHFATYDRRLPISCIRFVAVWLTHLNNTWSRLMVNVTDNSEAKRLADFIGLATIGDVSWETQ